MKSYQELETENQTLIEDIRTLERWNTEAENKIVNLKKLQGVINSRIFTGYVIASSIIITALLVKPLMTSHIEWLDSHINLDLPKCNNK